METLIFNIGKGKKWGRKHYPQGGHLTCYGYGDFWDMLNHCGEDLILQDGKYYTEGGHLAGYEDGTILDLDGDYDTWYLKPIDCLTYEECEAAVEEGYDEFDPFSYDYID